jgi:hypothetical protein
MARDNRKAGHGYEKKEARRLRESGLFPHVVTCRSESRSRDGQKVDLINKDEAVNSRMEYNIQCKHSKKLVKYHELLGQMPQLEGIISVIFHEYTEQSATGKFMVKGCYAILRRDDFHILMQQRRAAEILLEYVMQLPLESREKVVKRLTAIGL